MPIRFFILAYIDPTGGLPPSMWGMLLGSLLAGLGVAATGLKFWGWRLVAWFKLRRAILTALVALAVLGAGIFMGMAFFRSNRSASSASQSGNPRGPAKARGPRVLVLGLDGLDPILVESFMSQGKLPNLAKLAREGVYHKLTTTTPPQSPVAWSSFITGHEPGAEHGHGVFDFIRRNPKNYLPDLAIADRRAMALPWRGEPFWSSGAIERLGLTALRLPVTFPPPKLNGRLLAGMGVWDVRGTEGTYFFYSTRPVNIDDARGMLLELKTDAISGKLRGELPGPYRAGSADDVREPFEIDVSRPQAALVVQEKTYPLIDGQWSDWISVEFRMGAMKLQKVRAVTRVIFHHGDPSTLYVSPLNFDPVAPLYAISYPKSYSGELFESIGHYHTRGMPFDTQALSDGVLSDDDFLKQCQVITIETQKMLFRELRRFEQGMLFAYFESPDIIQHMFWRCIDPQHPLYASPEAAAHRNTIMEHYQQLDGIVGWAQAALGEQGALMVISDHGFAPFRLAVHVNAILRDLGYLKLKDGAVNSPEFFKNVDWSRTKAYAVGFNAIYLNLAGREGQGIVKAEEAAELARTIAAQLENFTDPADGQTRPIKQVYLTTAGHEIGDGPEMVVGYIRGYRASWETALGAVPAATVVVNDKKWSGDHCIDPTEVPGVIFTSDPKLDAQALVDVGAAVGRYLAR